MCVAGFPRRIYPAVNFPSRASYMGCRRDAPPLVGDYSRGRFAHLNLGVHLLKTSCEGLDSPFWSREALLLLGNR
jgi:hypothetical protein